MENILRTYGGNELLMDDTNEETRVKLNSSNKHKLLFDDKNEKIELLSTKNHKLLFDDKEKRIEIQSKKGRKVLLDDDNEVMSIVSETGHFIDVSDKNDVITVSDADEKHVLTLDYSNEKMSLVTKGDIGFEADGAIEMKSESLSIETKEGAEMTVGGDLTQSVDGGVTIEASKSGTIEAGQALDLSGVDVTVEGSNSFAAEGGAQAELKGAQLTVEGSAMGKVKGGTLALNG
jgi:type VI secretion system secreted protein VgrG